MLIVDNTGGWEIATFHNTFRTDAPPGLVPSFKDYAADGEPSAV